ncbi:S-isoprenylcysteine methyltransferase-like protein [Glycocaulis alkaliphilus]|uniref:S-isoprenylcysteine methyltransferase-like protein n=1 Tax=Glycocaulis alkaliphilus TaxID=1434191 RepID=A0A3T0E9P5_9PROT|nr:S-isoprenylcysteine methyltransferase-like protein [Glycocaulis alkaliphilus]
MLVSGTLGWGLTALTPGLGMSFPGQAALGLLVAALGVATAAAGILAFQKARTTLSPIDPGAATSLVVNGVYTRTRNPMYLGMAVMLLGWTLILGHPGGLVGIAFFVAYINHFQIQPEERALQTLFGNTFTAYCARVRRWI